MPVVKKCCENASASAGALVAVELALLGLVADLVADVDKRQLRPDVKTFLEAEVAGVAIAVVRSFETVNAAEDHELLALGRANANRVAGLVVVRPDGAEIEVFVLPQVEQQPTPSPHIGPQSQLGPQEPSQHSPPGEPIHSPFGSMVGPIIGPPGIRSPGIGSPDIGPAAWARRFVPRRSVQLFRFAVLVRDLSQRSDPGVVQESTGHGGTAGVAVRPWTIGNSFLGSARRRPGGVAWFWLG